MKEFAEWLEMERYNVIPKMTDENRNFYTQEIIESVKDTELNHEELTLIFLEAAMRCCDPSKFELSKFLKIENAIQTALDVIKKE